MNQVPISYLIIGNGHVSRHFKYYLEEQALFVRTWSRHDPLPLLHHYITQATNILILISDAAIDDFIKHTLPSTAARCVHFSGSLISDQAVGAHPLMSFSDTLYEADHYREIPFIIDEDAPEFESILPGLPNPHYRLSKYQKPKYHALCVLAGNFSCLLWQKLFNDFEHDLKIPPESAQIYLQQITNNLLTNAKTALTGPLVRGDTQTIQRNLNALDSDPFKQIYQSFVEAYKTIRKEKI